MSGEHPLEWSCQLLADDSGKMTQCYQRITMSGPSIASYPGHMVGGKSGLVSTVCACTNDSGNLPRTSLIMDKLHVVVMWRNNQTRYTACSVAAVFTWQWLPLSVVSVLRRRNQSTRSEFLLPKERSRAGLGA